MTKTESLFTVICPPNVGYYKLNIFAARNLINEFVDYIYKTVKARGQFEDSSKTFGGNLEDTWRTLEGHLEDSLMTV